MKLLKNRESGQALVLALILLALGSLLVVPGLNLSITDLNYHQSLERKMLESYSADAGIEYALCTLYNSPGSYTGTPFQASFNLNDKTVSVTTNYIGAGIYGITSTATSTNGRSTTIESFVNLSAGTFAYTIAAKSSLTITSGSIVKSDDPDGADIHSNGNISLTSNPSIQGDASAVGTISGQEYVTGDKYPGAPPIDFPGDYSNLYKIIAQEVGSHTGDVTLIGGTSTDPILFPSASPPYNYAYVQGNLTIWNNSYVRLTSTIYVTGALDMKPGSQLSGQENMLAEGNIAITGGAYTSSLIPVIISKNGNITCQAGGGGNKIINAVVYAPNGLVSMSQVELYGAVGGKTVTIGSNSIVTYSAQLQGRQDLPGGELATIAYSYK